MCNAFRDPFLRRSFRNFTSLSILNTNEELKVALKVGLDYLPRRLSDFLEEINFLRTE